MIEIKLKEIRQKRRLTQRAVSDLCGIKFYTEYAQFENYGRIPRVDKAIKIARALKTRVENIWIVN